MGFHISDQSPTQGLWWCTFFHFLNMLFVYNVSHKTLHKNLTAICNYLSTLIKHLWLILMPSTHNDNQLSLMTWAYPSSFFIIWQAFPTLLHLNVKAAKCNFYIVKEKIAIYLIKYSHNMIFTSCTNIVFTNFK